MKIASSVRYSPPQTQSVPTRSKRTVQPVNRERTSDDVLVSGIAGAALGACVSILPVSFLVQNGIGGNWAPLVTMIGGAAIGAGLMANSNVIISAESVPIPPAS